MYCGTYNNTVFSNMNIWANLSSIDNCAFFNNHMISNVKREECHTAKSNEFQWHTCWAWQEGNNIIKIPSSKAWYKLQFFYSFECRWINLNLNESVHQTQSSGDFVFQLVCSWLKAPMINWNWLGSHLHFLLQVNTKLLYHMKGIFGSILCFFITTALNGLHWLAT